MFDISRIAAISPDLRPADVFFNAEKIIETYRQAVEKGASVVLFPAMAVTGKSCGSLFFQPYLLASAAEAAEKIAECTGSVPAVFGMPVVGDGNVLECAVVAQNGRIAGKVVRNTPDIPGFAGEVPEKEGFFPAGRVFDGGLRFSVNFFGDMPQFPEAQLQLFLGAEGEVPGSWEEKKNFCRTISSQISGAAAMAFAGSGESTGDLLYGGALLIAAKGRILAERPSPSMAEGVIFADIDREEISAGQFKKSFAKGEKTLLAGLPDAPDFAYLYNPQHPFLPQDPQERAVFCRETLDIQCIALAERLKRCGAEKMVLGISGGLDSTLALVVLARLCKKYDFPMQRILAVTMPGFGTTGRTKNNALKLAEKVGAEIREIPIAKACEQHFQDIGHDPNVTNSVYENSQARERTQILMDIANGCSGIVIGTGDLSEIALGWSTFNGDQMAMYAVNCSIPKSNIAAILEYAAKELPGTEEILQDVIDTPVSPELLPLDENGEIAQKTENILGAYEIHDYYLYKFMQGVSKPEKLLKLAEAAFGGKYPVEELLRVRELFMRRFFTQQFKRSAGPDGIQAGEVSLSARNAWLMGADISGKLWRNK